jgi:hypothetical protein
LMSAARAELANKPVTSSPATSGTIRRIMSISIHLDDFSVIDGMRA